MDVYFEVVAKVVLLIKRLVGWNDDRAGLIILAGLILVVLVTFLVALVFFT